MPGVVGIRFKSCGKIYDFEVNGLEVKPGDRVVVESEFGLSIGNVVAGPRTTEGPEKDMKKVLRLASEDDVKQKRQNEQFEREARSFCLERIMARGLPMKLVCSEVTLDRKRIIFYFTADGRIDFRELVKDLAARFRTRIEMRQIGVRDKAKMVGGLGLCGKELCCRLFLTSFEPISIKMAKQQELVLNTGKLSGVCGRLMCCLGYEYSEAGPAEKKTTAVGVPDEQAQAVAGEAQEPFDEPEPLPEIVCCPAEDTSPAAPTSASAAGEQKTEKGKRRRRRRRFRKRAKQNE